MKIIFAAMMFVFSVVAQADEAAMASGVADSATQSIMRPSPAEWKEMSSDQRSAWIDKANEESRIHELERQQKMAQKNIKLDEQIKLRDAAFEKEHLATTPKCSNIRFTGIATPAPDGGSVIAQVFASHDIEDTIARNPIQCRANQFGNSSCTGVAYLQKHKGRIENWDRDSYTIYTQLDFNTGRRGIELTVRRKDSACIDGKFVPIPCGDCGMPRVQPK